MKTFAAIFLVLFVIGGASGFLKGRAEVTDPRVIKNIAVRSLELATKSIPKDGVQVYNLVYRRDGQVLFAYDVDANFLHTEPVSELVDTTRPEYGLSEATTANLIGGAAMGFTSKDLIKLIATEEDRPKNIKRFLAGAFGAVTGYLVGHWLGTCWAPDRDSDPVLTFLSSDADWAELEETVYRIQSAEIYKNASLMTSDEDKVYFREAAVRLYSKIKNSGSSRADLKSEDFGAELLLLRQSAERPGVAEQASRDEFAKSQWRNIESILAMVAVILFASVAIGFGWLQLPFDWFHRLVRRNRHPGIISEPSLDEVKKYGGS